MKATPKTCEELLTQFSISLEDLKSYATRGESSGLSESQSRELIAHFEETHELALKVISKYFEKQGKGPFSGSRDATVEAFHAELIDNGKGWLDMVIDRIQYNPVYALDTQQNFLENIRNRYIRMFDRFERKMMEKLEE
ncbi:nucleotidyltransferase substrate binding protein [Algoriphagus jejuensis]|uniref:Nucleotidyltransferase substrate binding protein n=1 Tax=Algoriphagus jejuensis TaxID=419934 RepID=A0ABP3YBP2_9BACT